MKDVGKEKSISDFKVIEMPDKLDELSMELVKGGSQKKDSCCGLNFACNGKETPY